jgi:methionine sulfoxide reductase heme-binding subunit
VIPFAAAGPSAYWYLARGTGAVSLLLLTASVVLGVLGSLRYSAAPRWPRFAIDTLHRDISLLVIAVLIVHIVTSVLDTFAPIRLIDAVVPFVSNYRPVWLGLGAVVFDVMIALVVTSLLRRRLGYGAWRLVHWLAYASWPVALLHGLGTGSDTNVWWMLALTAGCAAAVLAAVLVRIARGFSSSRELRLPAFALSLATMVAVAAFTMLGPLRPHWARRSGTPRALLVSTVKPVAGRASARRRGQVPSVSPGVGGLKVPFSASLAGTIKQTPRAGGALVDLALRLSGVVHGRLRIRLAGAPLGTGGLSLTGSQVDLLADGSNSIMAGRIVSLQGQQFLARVADGFGGTLDLHANLVIDNQSSAVTGTLTATSAGASG